MAVLPESEGELEVLTLKMPTKLKARVDAVARGAFGGNRTQTMLALMRHALITFEAELAEKQRAEAKKPKGR